MARTQRVAAIARENIYIKGEALPRGRARAPAAGVGGIVFHLCLRERKVSVAEKPRGMAKSPLICYNVARVGRLSHGGVIGGWRAREGEKEAAHVFRADDAQQMIMLLGHLPAAGWRPTKSRRLVAGPPHHVCNAARCLRRRRLIS